MSNEFNKIKRDIMRLALEEKKEIRLISFADILKEIRNIEDELETREILAKK